MTKADMIREIANTSGETQTTVRNVVSALEGVVMDVCKNQDSLVLGGVKVSGVMKEAHTARNPSTGETVQVPAKIRVVTKAMNSLKTAVND